MTGTSEPGASTSGRLVAQLADRSAVVGVVGLGYVGLPLAHAFVRAGLRVIGFDVDPAKIADLATGRPYLDHLGPHLFRELADSAAFDATAEMGRLGEPDVVLVAVPTPLGRHYEPDLRFVTGVARDLARVVRPGQLVVLESTTYPGTTRDEFAPILAAAAHHGRPLELGRDVFVAYSPEREDPGRPIDSVSIPKLVGGLDDTSRDLAVAAYALAFEQVIPVSSAEVAEAAKLLENIFRAVNIALVNEMKVVLTDLGVDVWEVIDAAATKPFGFMPFYPGPGLGGHCIPIDPFYLTWKAKEVGRPVEFIELAGLVNHRMPRYVVDRLAEGLNDQGKPVRGSRVLVIGLAYKANVGDTRESPSFELIELLRARGAAVDYHDPHVPQTLPVRRHDLGMSSVPIGAETVAAYDAVLISTAHAAVEYELIARHALLVVDTRNAMAPYAGMLGARLVKA
jgi:UDP-N-acetyl-D-glucosamine dehydrogenase